MIEFLSQMPTDEKIFLAMIVLGLAAADSAEAADVAAGLRAQYSRTSVRRFTH
jgi:hypothetical protein